MKVFFYPLLAATVIPCAFADNIESASQTAQASPAPALAVPVVVNNNDKYIDKYAYIQNPYTGLPSQGGTQNLTESQIANQNVAEKWFSGGTWNVMGSASYVTLNGTSNYGYGANIFGQTGQVAGFSFGGLLTIINPAPIGPALGAANQDQFLPTNQVILPTELFAEYQYKNIIQADVGRIAITNSPWLTQAYYNNMLTPGMTYQGGLVNLNPGGGWLITALGFNAALPISATSASNLTMYNSGFDYGTQTANVSNATSQGTAAIGGTFYGLDNNYNLRIWGYHFGDYANLGYADNSLKLIVNKDTNFTLAAQGGYEHGVGPSLMATNGDGHIDSTFVGLQAGMNYKWFGLNLGMNSIWGAGNDYLGGGIVSPYTYELATDPLYSTSYMMGMVEKAAGNAFKISPSFTFLDGNLAISPSYAYYATSSVPNSSEYDFIVSYNVQQVKGLSFIMNSAYLLQAPYIAPFSNNAGVSSTGNAYTVQVGANYLY